jgi:hypothetical protein
MVVETISKPMFQLGRTKFTVHNCDQVFVQELAKVLPRCRDDQLSQDEPYDVRMGCEKTVRGLLNHILKRHLGCLWISAAYLISPSGKKLLIAGSSGSGKSTLAAALSLGYGWKALSEDLTLFDVHSDEIIPFNSPFSIKPGSVELLNETVGCSVGPLILDEWMPLGEAGSDSNCDAHTDVVLILERNADPGPIQFSSLSPDEFLLRILPHSNIVRLPGAASGKITEYVSSGKCYRSANGSLKERLDLVFTLIG